MNSIFPIDLLRGQRAIVTGGGSGIGAEIARWLARHGADVGLMGRRLEMLDAVSAEIEREGGRALSLQTDVRDMEAVEAAVERAAQDFGGLDIVVNSAAGNFPAAAQDLSSNGFKAVIDIDVVGTFHVSRAAFTHLADGGGSIVNITAPQSVLAMAMQSHVGAAKAGVDMLTRDLALEWSRFGIRVNAISPGPIADTEGTRRLMRDEERMTGRLPLGRMGRKDEIAQAVLYLCSPAAAYITGIRMAVDGGLELVGAGALS